VWRVDSVQRHPVALASMNFQPVRSSLVTQRARLLPMMRALTPYFMLQPVRHHLKLQLAHRAQQQQRPGNRTKDLNRAFFT
jgi:hypothetical protein